MAPFFQPDTIQQLEEGVVEVRGKFGHLRDKYVRRAWTQPKAAEYARHGFARRLSLMLHCIDTVFETIPPALEEIPPRKTVMEATVAIQAFVINVQGCIDNLAWVWVAEKNVRESDNTEIAAKRVGLGQQNRSVRRSFSQHFRDYLESREAWFEHLKQFRDSLAHRIPLYIPPYVITPNLADQYDALTAAINAALAAGNLAEYEARNAEQDALGVFRPLMLHSRTENSPGVVFHAQLLADFNTIDELGREMLAELDR